MERPLHEATLRDYLRVVFRRLPLLVLCVVLVPAVAVTLALRQHPLYSSTAEVLLSNEDLASSLAGVSQPYVDPVRFSQTQVAVAETPDVAQRVVQAAKVPGLTAGAFLGSASVSANANADLLYFTVNDRDPNLAVLLATTYATQYTLYRQQLDTAAIRRALTDVNARLAQLETQTDATSVAYRRTLSNQAEQLRTLLELRTANARVIRQASGAAKIQPRPVRYGALGLGLGLILGIGLVFLAEALDTRVRKADEISSVLSMPLLARIPEPPRSVRRKNGLVVFADSGSGHAEAFRLMRANLEFMNLDREARTIMITSAREGEGKSTTAANLAVTLALGGKSVALVDLDLRKPSLERFFAAERQPGITDVVLGRKTLEGALEVLVIGNQNDPHAVGNGTGELAGGGSIQLLTAGQPLPNPGEFVASRAVKAILDQLAARADFVIVDVPPLLHVGDALGIAGRVDGVILVTRMKLARRPMLGEVRRILDACPADRLGFVLTGVTAHEGYGYGYGAYEYRAPRRERERVR